MMGKTLTCFAAGALLGFSGFAARAEVVTHDQAAGYVLAASLTVDRCKGLRWVGKGDDQSFVIASAAILAAQGFSDTRMRYLLFYASTESLNALGTEALARRGVSLSDRNGLCRFGKSVAGAKDRIGQFLVRGK